MKRIEGFGSKVYIVNSGWTGGSYGVGERFNIPTTRNIIKAIQSGSIEESPKSKLDIMNVEIPTELEGVETKILNPSETWSDQGLYKKAAEDLDEEKLKSCNFYIITVPTPITALNKPDLRNIKASCRQLSKILKKNDIVVFFF